MKIGILKAPLKKAKDTRKFIVRIMNGSSQNTIGYNGLGIYAAP